MSDQTHDIPEIEFHGGKRPREMTTGELLAAIAYSPRPDTDSVSGRWATKLAAEFDRRRARIVEAQSKLDEFFESIVGPPLDSPRMRSALGLRHTTPRGELRGQMQEGDE